MSAHPPRSRWPVAFALAFAFACAACLLVGCPDKRSPPSTGAQPAAPASASRSAPEAAPKPPAPVAPPVDAAPAPPADAAVAPPAEPARCEGTPGDAPIMAPCADHCDCATGYCDDSDYLGRGFRFCSMDCNTAAMGACGKRRHPTQPHLQKYGCVQLHALRQAHTFTTSRLCVLRCNSVDECKAYDPAYDQCGNASGGRLTQWGGSTIAAFGTCLISDAMPAEKQ